MQTEVSRKVDLSIVVPVFNEVEILEHFQRRVEDVLRQDSVNYEIVYVDDGSQDGSFEKLRTIQAQHQGQVKVVRLGRNFGHQLAITAGIKEACGLAVVVMDCDLQDPPEVIPQFIEKWRAGYEVVYGVRTKRKGETLFKRFSAYVFYKIIRWASGFDIPENVGDFYLLDRKVVDVFNTMQERHRFIRGMVAWVGFRRVGIGYVRESRAAGRTKFGFWRMVKFSFDAATSFSFLPLRVISLCGALISGAAFLGIILIVFLRLFTQTTVTGWSSLMVVVLFVGGIQLLSIGVIGEYVARIGDDVKARPLYTIAEIIS